MKLEIDFFKNKSTLKLAKDLIGVLLVYETDEGVLKGIINETEAYTQDDESSHSYGAKKTKRNEIMFGRAGHLYIYFTYGMYYCLNIVSGEDGIGEAVLIRSIIPIEGEKIMIKNRSGNFKNIANGPGKLCQAYLLNKNLNGMDILDKNSKIYLEYSNYVPEKIFQTKRIGISKGKELEWRFFAKSFKN